MQTNPNGTITVRIRASQQVIDMVPDVARAMILGGTAEHVKRPETMAVAGGERAVLPSPAHKAVSSRRKN